MTTPQKTKGLRIATRCTSIEQFVAAFHRFCDEQSFFISTLATRPVGLETAFSVDLADGAPALRGLAVVLDAWATADNPFGRPGVHLGVRRLTADSEQVFANLLLARAAATKTPAPEPVPEPVAAAPEPIAPPPRPLLPTPPPLQVVRAKLVTPPPLPVVKSAPPVAPAAVPFVIPVIPVSPPIVAPAPPPQATPVIAENEPATTRIVTRTPGSELILPANPLTGITDQSLEGFVDCTIFEETGNFFPIDEWPPAEDPADPVAPPPMFAPIGGHARPPSAEPPIELAREESISVSPIAYEPAPQAPVAAVEYPLASQPFTNPPLAPEPAQPTMRRDDTGQIAMRPARNVKRWYLIGAIAAVVVAVIAIVAAAKSSAAKPDAGAQRAATSPVAPTPPAVETPHAGEPTHAGTAAQARTVVADTHPVEPEEPQVAGTPVVGKGPCRMTFETTPAGSIVQLDGKPVGPSPLTVNGTCERHQVTVTHARYQSASRWVAPTEGKPDTVEVVLERPTHSLMVETAPLGATISIGGRRAGTSPTIVELMGYSTIAVTISKPGFVTTTKRIYSKSPNDKLFVRLTRQQ